MLRLNWSMYLQISTKMFFGSIVPLFHVDHLHLQRFISYHRNVTGDYNGWNVWFLLRIFIKSIRILLCFGCHFLSNLHGYWDWPRLQISVL